jgi:hypothetical protein
MTSYRALPFVLAGSLSFVVAVGCQGGPPPDDGAKAKMAADLVGCQNEKSQLKDKIDELTMELNKLKAAQAAAADTPKPTEQPAVEHARGSGGGGGGGGGGPKAPPVAATELVSVVKKNSAGLRTCYEKGLKHNPNLQYVSTVNVRFQVDTDGIASGVGFSPHSDREMEKCMGQQIVKWKFPTFRGDPVQVEAPVNLVAK